MRRVIAVATVFAACLAGAADGAGEHPQHDVLASSHSRTVKATLGTNCTPTDGGVRCTDSTYPLRTKERLRIHPRGTIELRFHVKPEEIDPQLRDRRSRSVFELRATGRGRKRTIRLPRELPRGTDRLGFFVSYEKGDADFEVDLKRHRHLSYAQSAGAPSG